MISENGFRELLAQKAETKNLDFKESLNWDEASNEAKCELVKDILAFLNTQDGGSIVFGVRDSAFEPIGLSEADFASFDITKVNDFLHRYTDPPGYCEVQKMIVDGLRFVVITVSEFKDVPIICKKAANSSVEPYRTILKAAGLYIRTEKATTEIVGSAEAMRDLINRALLKRGDQLLNTINALLRGNPPSQQSEIPRYAKEIDRAHSFFKDALDPKVEEQGYWEVTAMPLTYSRDRIATITEVRRYLTESEVSLRGWDFPHRDRDTNSNFENGFQSFTELIHHLEAHRAYQSGLFAWRCSYWENRADFQGNNGRCLSFINVIYTITEFFIFLRRYYERVAPDESVRFSMKLTDIKDRALVATGEAMLYLDRKTAKIPILYLEDDYAVSEIRASAEEIAIKTVQRVFEIFNWNNPDANMIRGWQQRLLSRTL